MSPTLAGARVLVAGGAGFVGSNLVRALVSAGAGEITVVDNLLSSEKENLPASPRVRFVEGSIADDGVLAGLPRELDFVFHLATFHGNQNSIADPIADHANNLLPTLKLLERLRAMRGLTKVVYASAGCVVAEKTWEDAHATQEDAPVSLWLDSPYQISKIVGELYGNFYFQRHGVPFVKARFQNVYGPGEVLGAGRWRGTPATVWRNVTPTFVWRALRGLPLVLENGGVATRDFIFVDDVVRGLMLCAAEGEPGGVYNLASGVETKVRELAELVNELAGGRSKVEVGPARDWDRSGKRLGATEKSEKTLGFRARVSLREGLERTIAWTRENAAFVERCVARHAAEMARAGA